MITAPIGAGGMGEVYRARDSKLNRDVAIKVLPSTLATDAIVSPASSAKPIVVVLNWEARLPKR